MENLKERGFVPGATVRQHRHIGSTDYDDAKILCVHETGALDVEIGGVRYGWSASVCSVVAPPAVCQSCGKAEATEPHTCPVSVCMSGDEETLCNCCMDCENDCSEHV